MLLTIFYASATLMQSWRMRSLSLNIVDKIRENYSISFYKTGTVENGTSSIGASSELCENYRNGRIVDTLWYENILRGVSILPKLQLSLNQWTTFAVTPQYNPLYCSHNDTNSLILDENNLVYILLETNIYPDINAISRGNALILAEKFGVPLAWKIDTNLAIVLQSDVSQFNEFVRQTFIQNTLFINNYLPITRIQNVLVTGSSQNLVELENLMTTSSHASELLTETQCRNHIDKLRILSLAANIQSEPSPDDYEKVIVETTPSHETFSFSCDTMIDVIAKSENGDITELDAPVETKATEPEAQAENAKEEIVGNGSVANGSAVTIGETEINEKMHETTNGTCIHYKSMRGRESISSTECSGSQYSTLKRQKRNSDGCKPPNVLVYSESIETRTNVISTIKNILHPDHYTIYELNTEQLKTSFWIDNTTLLIVCGSIPPAIGSILMEYYLCGGKMLCLCSDVLNMVLPIYHTAEVRENELVSFSYGKWQKVQLMHHVFCYHPSPIKKHFSIETDEQDSKIKPPLACPGSIDLKDLRGDPHRLVVKVLGSEEIWNTPSLILATDTSSNGIAVFSQVHLEVDPNLYEYDDSIYDALKRSDATRLEILSNLLSTELGLKTHFSDERETKYFPNAYFLGCFETKQNLLEHLKSSFTASNSIKVDNFTYKFYSNTESPPKSIENQLSILIHACPENFSTLKYYNLLKTRKIGRLVVYASVMPSTHTFIRNLKNVDGLAVIARKQTSGEGRSKNQWLSPDGCALFSFQLIIPLSSPLGRKLPLLQHLVSLAIVTSIANDNEYKKLDIRLKWPNDIYVNGNVKLGGVIANTAIGGTNAICNIGVGFNLDNCVPTTCLNEVIKNYNLKHSTNMPYMEYEQFFASVFNQIEHLVDVVQNDDFKQFFDLYYKFWLHSDAEIIVVDANGSKKLATIIGVDEYGYLLVQQTGHAPETVLPDGNTFDILRGLISTKSF